MTYDLLCGIIPASAENRIELELDCDLGRVQVK